MRSNLDGHGSIYDLDERQLEELKPDLIITQELCEVCAVSYKTVQKAAKMYVADATVVSLEPNTIADIFDNIRTVAELAKVKEKGIEVVENLQNRLDKITEKTAHLENLPRVFMLEWLEPPFAPGHWVPEQVEIAGGVALMGEAGKKSVTIDYEQIFAEQPEIIVLIPCGYYIHDIQRQLELTDFPADWRELPAVKNNNVWAMDASAYFSRPAPRVVDGTEILAKIFHPNIFGEPNEKEAVRVELNFAESDLKLLFCSRIFMKLFSIILLLFLSFNCFAQKSGEILATANGQNYTAADLTPEVRQDFENLPKTIAECAPVFTRTADRQYFV